MKTRDQFMRMSDDKKTLVDKCTSPKSHRWFGWPPKFCVDCTIQNRYKHKAQTKIVEGEEL